MSYQRLKTDINGGFPLVLDDIRWLQGELSGPFVDYLEDICPANGLVWVSGGGYPSNAITPNKGFNPGVVYIKGQGFFNVDNNNGCDWATNTFVRIQASTFNSAGTKTFQNGTTNNTYELPQADVIQGTSSTGDVLFNNWVYLNETFNRLVVTFASGITNGGTFKVIANANRLVISCTQINGPAGTRTTDEDLFTLDTAIFDPEGTKVDWAAAGSNEYLPVTIDSNGKVTARWSALAGGGEYPLGFEIHTVIA